MRGASLLLLTAPCGGGDPNYTPTPTPSLSLAVTPAGGISVALGELRLAVSSTFTEAGGARGHLRAMGTAVDPPQPLDAWSEGVAVAGAGTSWSITAGAGSYSVNRTVVAEGHRLRISDRITAASGSGPVGIAIAHRTSFVGQGGEMLGALLPAGPDTWACTSIADEEATPPGDRTTLTSTGNPTIHAHGTHGGAGLIPLDDVFETHSFANNSAFPTNKLPVQSDPPASRAKSNVCGNHHPNPPPCICPVTDPPSISLEDPSLVLPPGETYVQEWAVYPLPASCADYYCFINSKKATAFSLSRSPTR